MEDTLRVVAEMNQWIWSLLKVALDDLSSDEINWRPLPQANSINLIVRHLRIEAQWHLDSLTRGDVMPSEVTAALQEEIDDVPLDFQCNLDKLEELYTGFLDMLRSATWQGLQERTASAYCYSAEAPGPAHLLAYHQAVHMALHCGQIRTIRNLYRKTRGESARFFPENPTYPR